MSNNNLTDSIFEAVDIIVQNAVDKIKYDQTVICTITDSSNAKEHRYYMVSDGSIEFKAFSENTDYKNGDSVRVSIPNGNFDDAKYIIGKCIVDEDQAIQYSLPTEQILKVVKFNNEDGVSLVANQTNTEQYLFDESDDSYFMNNIYDVFYIEFDVRTDFGSEKIICGNYGIQIEMFDNQNHRTVFEIDSSEFFGNSFSYILTTKQAKVFNIVDISEIKKVVVKPYQNNNFYIDGGESFISELEQPNIYFTNVEFGLGFNLTTLQDNTVKLFSTGNLSFKHTNPRSSNDKTVGFLWCNKNDTNHFIGFNDGVGKIIQKTSILSSIEEKLINSGITIEAVEGSPDKSSYDFSQFDEVKYQEEIQEINNLLAQKSSTKLDDEHTLKFSLQIETIYQQLSSLYLKLNDLAKSLYNLRVNFTGNSELQNLVDQKLDAVNDKCEVISKYITGTDQVDNLKKYCSDILLYIYETKTNVENRTVENIKPPYTKDFLTDISFTEDFIDWTDLDIKIVSYSDFATSYERKRNEIREEVIEISNYVNVIKGFDIEFNNDVYTLKYKSIAVDDDEAYIEKTYDSETLANLISYISPDFSSCSNLYSIYWYRYQEGYKNENDCYIQNDWMNLKDCYIVSSDCNIDIDETTTLSFYKNEILYLKEDDDNAFTLSSDINRDGIVENYTFSTLPNEFVKFPINLGLPEISTKNSTPLNYKQTYNFEKLSENNNTVFSCFLNPDLKEEKFKVVIVYNHEMYESNELIFSNAENFDDEIQGLDSILSIAHGANSKKDYFLYDNTSYLSNGADASQKRILTAAYNGTDNIINSEIFWYFPNSSTMLDYKMEDLEAAGFVPVRTYKKTGKTGADNNIYSISETNTVTDSGNDLSENQAFIVIEYKTISDIKYAKIHLIEELNNEIENDEEAEEDIWIKYEGDFQLQPLVPIGQEYVVFSKIIESNADLSFPYYIKGYYLETSINNTIKCKIVISDTKQCEAQETFSFGYLSSNGTNYKLVVQPEYPLDQRAITPEEHFTLQVCLYDTNNQKINLSDGQVTYSWVGPSGETYGTNNISSTFVANEYRITLEKSDNLTNFYGVLKICANVDVQNSETTITTDGITTPVRTRQVSLETYYAIPWAKETTYYIEGADKIIYNSLGNEPKYYSGSYVLYDSAFSDENDESANLIVNPVVWTMKYLDEDGEVKYRDNDGKIEYLNGDNWIDLEDEVEDPILGLPKLIKDAVGNTAIIEPCTMYVNNLNLYPIVQCINSDEEVLWSQPIYIGQNRFESNILNNWSGQGISIDNDTASIMASMLGAGKKEDDNSFSGVVMGDVQATTGLTIQTENDKINSPKTGLGIYGIHKGDQSFGFNVDGSAFLGKSGKGRIYFDGNYGVIKSGAWDGTINEDGEISQTGSGGMAIALEKGHIDAHDFKLTSEKITMNSNPPAEGYYLTIGNDANHIRYSASDELEIKAKKFELTSGNWGGTNLLSNTEPFEPKGSVVTRKWENLGDISDNLFSNAKDGKSGLYFLRDDKFNDEPVILKQKLDNILEQKFYTISGKYLFNPVNLLELTDKTRINGHIYYISIDNKLQNITDERVPFTKDEGQIYIWADMYAFIDNYSPVEDTHEFDDLNNYALQKRYNILNYDNEDKFDNVVNKLVSDETNLNKKYLLGIPNYVAEDADMPQDGLQYYYKLNSDEEVYISYTIPNRHSSSSAPTIANIKETLNIEDGEFLYYIDDFTFYECSLNDDGALIGKEVCESGDVGNESFQYASDTSSEITLTVGQKYVIQKPVDNWEFVKHRPYEDTALLNKERIDLFQYDNVIYEYDGYTLIENKDGAKKTETEYYNTYLKFDGQDEYIDLSLEWITEDTLDSNGKFKTLVYELKENNNWEVDYQESLQTTDATKHSHKNYYYLLDAEYKEVPEDFTFEIKNDKLIIKQYTVYRKTDDEIYVSNLPEDDDGAGTSWAEYAEDNNVYIYIEEEDNYRRLNSNECNLPIYKETITIEIKNETQADGTTKIISTKEIKKDDIIVTTETTELTEPQEDKTTSVISYKFDEILVYEQNLPRLDFIIKTEDETETETETKIGSIYIKEKNCWKEFSYTFEDCNFPLSVDDEGVVIFNKVFLTQLYDNGFPYSTEEQSYYIVLSQLKLESGVVATTWDKSEDDLKYEKEHYDGLVRKLVGKYEALEEEFNTELSQEKLFAELTNGYSNQGVFMENGQLFINATQIATGAIKSQNWALSGGAVDDYGNIVSSGTEGTALSLTTGHLDARNFKLTAGRNDGEEAEEPDDYTLYLNSNPEDGESYLKVGDTDSYLKFSDDTLDIKSQKFNLEAENTLELKSDPIVGESFFKVSDGGDADTGNFIKMEKTDSGASLSIQATDFKMTIPLASVNILNNTLPREPENELIVNDWSSDRGVLMSSKIGNKKCLKFINLSNNDTMTITQELDSQLIKYFTLSFQGKIQTIASVNAVENGSDWNDDYQYYLTNTDNSIVIPTKDKALLTAYSTIDGIGGWRLYNPSSYQIYERTNLTYLNMGDLNVNEINSSDNGKYIQDSYQNEDGETKTSYKKVPDNFPLTSTYALSEVDLYIKDGANYVAATRNWNSTETYYYQVDSSYEIYSLGKNFTNYSDRKLKTFSNGKVVQIGSRYQKIDNNIIDEDKDYYILKQNDKEEYRYYKIENCEKYKELISSSGQLSGSIITITENTVSEGSTASVHNVVFTTPYIYDYESNGTTTNSLTNLTWEFEEGDWVDRGYFTKTIKEKDSTTNNFTISIPSQSILYLHQLQLEEGQNQTIWTQSVKDQQADREENEKIAQDIVRYYEELETTLDTSFTQEKLFAELTNGYADSGIYEKNGYLFINADKIATGTIASQNWYRSGGAIDDYGEIQKSGEQGMAISLADGHIDANDFKITAGDTLILDSDPEEAGDPYFKVGNEEHYIEFLENGDLSLRAKDFSLSTAFTGDNLLSNTAPEAPIGTMIPSCAANELDAWYFDKLNVYSCESKDPNEIGRRKCLTAINAANEFQTLSQTVLNPKESFYSLSGTVLLKHLTPCDITSENCFVIYATKNNISKIWDYKDISTINSYIYEEYTSDNYLLYANYNNYYQDTTLTKYVSGSSGYQKVPSDLIDGTNMKSTVLYKKSGSNSYVEINYSSDINITNGPANIDLYYKNSSNEYKLFSLGRDYIKNESNKAYTKTTALYFKPSRIPTTDSDFNSTKRYYVYANGKYQSFDVIKYKSFITTDTNNRSKIDGITISAYEDSISNSLTLSNDELKNAITLKDGETPLSYDNSCCTIRTISPSTNSSCVWHDFQLVFEVPETLTTRSDKLTFSVQFGKTGINNGVITPFCIYFYKLKLSVGKTRTNWSQSAKDLADNVKAQESITSELLERYQELEDELSAAFTQEKLFAELTNGYYDQGLFTKDGRVFINATQIATGAIKSQNWALSGGAIDDYGNILASGSEGSAFSLSTGQIDARYFKLMAGSVSTTSTKAPDKFTIYLNSNPLTTAEDSYLKVGNDTNYIRFDGNGSIDIKSQKFNLTASDKLILNSSPASNSPYFKVSNGSSFMEFTNDGGVKIQASTFKINTTNQNFVIDSTATGNNVNLRIGRADGADGFQYSQNGGLLIKGNITATAIDITTAVSGNNVQGFAKVALTGKYGDVIDSPRISYSETSEGDGVVKRVITVDETPSGGNKYVYNTYTSENGKYLLLGVPKGTYQDPSQNGAGYSSSPSYNYFKVEESGCLKANNAIIWGTIYATNGRFTGTVYANDGKFTGKIEANEGYVGGWTISGKQLFCSKDIKDSRGTYIDMSKYLPNALVPEGPNPFGLTANSHDRVWPTWYSLMKSRWGIGTEEITARLVFGRLFKDIITERLKSEIQTSLRLTANTENNSSYVYAETIFGPGRAFFNYDNSFKTEVSAGRIVFQDRTISKDYEIAVDGGVLHIQGPQRGDFSYINTEKNLYSNLYYEVIQIGSERDDSMVFISHLLNTKLSSKTIAATDYYTTSDEKLKENINSLNGVSSYNLRQRNVPSINYSSFFDKLIPVSYTYNTEKIRDGEKIRYGLLAQQVMEAMEESGISIEESGLISSLRIDKNDNNEYYSINYINFIALLISEVQKLKQEVSILKETSNQE